jgi:hypothetical protein
MTLIGKSIPMSHERFTFPMDKFAPAILRFLLYYKPRRGGLFIETMRA